MKLLLFILFFSTLSFAQSNVKSLEVELIHGQNANFRNYVKNPTCQRNAGDITASATAAVRNTTDALDGKSDCTWNPAVSTETLKWQVKTWAKGLKGRNCEARVLYSGDARLVKASVFQNSLEITSEVTLTDTGSNSAVAPINFPCGDGSIATEVVLESTGDAANVSYSIYVGEATNVGSVAQASFVGSAYYETTTNCVWVRTGTTLGAFGTDADCPGPTVELNPGPGTIQTTDADLPQFTFNNLPAGTYRVIISGHGTKATTNNNAFTISDGTNTSGRGAVSATSGDGDGLHIEGVFEYTAAGNRTFSVFASAASGNIEVHNNIDNKRLYIHVYRFPSSSEQAVRMDTTAMSWSGYHDNTCSWARTNTAYGDFTADASCALVERTNRNFGTVSASGSVLPQISFTPPKVGRYYVCAHPKWYCGGSVPCRLRLFDGTNTISETEHNLAARQSLPVCGIYNATSTSAAVIELEGAAASGAITIDASGGGDTTIDWSIFALDVAIPAPLLVGGVTSSSSGVERVERVAFGGATPDSTVCSASPCTIWRSTPGVTSVTWSATGTYVINFAAGTFSASPTCTGIGANGTNGIVIMSNGTPTSTTFGVQTVITTTAAAANGWAYITCMGPR